MKKDVLTSAFIDIRAKMHRIAVKHLLNDEDARDALQDTFEKLWSKSYIESDEEARNKLVRVLHNTCIDRLRNQRTVALDAVKSEVDRGYEPPIEDMAKYESLITSGLTPMQMQIYNMITHDCLEYDEIAARMGISVEAVRMNMCRVRKKIKETIKIIDR